MIVKIGDVISEYSVRNKFDENIPVYSVTNEKGFCTGYFSKEVASKDKSTYKIVPRGYFAYNPSRINVGSVDWQKYEDRVIVSPLYVVFGVSDRLDRQYLLHYLKSDMMLSFIKEYATGSVRDNLKLADLGEFPINLRPVEEQRQIAATLDKIDDLIAKRRQQLDKLDELVKSRFIEMFGDPITNEMGWEKVQLSTCIESIDNGKSLVCDTSARQGNWPAVLKLSAATYGFYRPEENKAMLDENQFVEDAAVRAGDLLFTRKNTPELVGMCAYVYDTPSRLMMPDLIFRLNTTNRCNKVFLWKLINHNLFRDCIRAISTGSAKSMSNISKERLLNLEIILPPAELQEQFAVFVAQIDKSKYRQEKCIGFFQCLEKTLDRSGYDVEFWLSQNEKRI